MNNKSSIQARRIAILAQKSETVFHIKDLANLWDIRDQKTLRMTVKRYADSALIFRIYRGFYSTLPLEKLDPEWVGFKALHTYCYLSTETVLFKAGTISQKPNYITFVSGHSKKFAIGGMDFSSRKLQDLFLYNSEGISQKNGFRTASVERAIADMLYFNPLCPFDKKIDWKAIKNIQKKIGYPLTTDRYDIT